MAQPGYCRDRRLKVALINPRAPGGNARNRILTDVWRRIEGKGQYTWQEYRQYILEWIPSLGLLTIGGFFSEADEVVYIEEEMEGLDLSVYFDLVCLGALNNQGRRAYQIAQHFRSRGIPTVMGGYHASTLPAETSEYVDSVIVGEGEDTFPRYLQDLQVDRPERVYHSTGSADLTQVPPPRFDLVRHLPGFTKVPLQVTRGCPHHCEFCCIIKVYGPRYRHKTVEQVVEEIRTVKELYGDPYLSFTDENMFIDRKFARELMRAMIPLNVLWEAYTDIAIAYDREMLELLPQAGCCELLIGLESVNPNNLRQIDAFKARQGAKYGNLVQRIQQHGVAVMGLFVVGLDEDDETTFESLRDFIAGCGMFDVDFSLLCPIPGTPLHERMKQEERLLTQDWDVYDWYNVTYVPRKLTPERLMQGILWLFGETYQPWMVEHRIKYFQAAEARSPERLRLAILRG